VQYVSDWYDLEHHRGLSAFQARHNLTANASSAGLIVTGM
jgi:hypothetical protein